MYDDDTTAFCDSITIHQWCAKNRLTIHPEKTKAMILNRHKFIGPLNELNLGEQTIEYVHTSECLGVLIDRKLTWKPQIETIRKSFGAKVKKLKNLKYLSQNFLEEIYFTTVIPTITYAIAPWGTCSESLFEELENIHVQAARVIKEDSTKCERQ